MIFVLISKNCLYLASRRIVGVSRLIGWRLRVHHNAASDVTVHTNVTMQCHESARLIVDKVLYSCNCCNAIRIPKMSKRKHSVLIFGLSVLIFGYH